MGEFERRTLPRCVRRPARQVRPEAIEKTLERLAGLKPTTLACMHGAAWTGNGGELLRALADTLEASRAPAPGALSAAAGS